MILESHTVSSDQRIYVIPDIHGDYDLLVKAYRDLGIKKEETKVFLGDMIDYGYKSLEVMKLAERSDDTNTYSIRGNHEQKALESRYGLSNAIDWTEFYGGGNTYKQITDNNRQWFYDYLERLPFSLEIKRGDNVYGFTHGGFPKIISERYDFQDISKTILTHQYGINLAIQIMTDRSIIDSILDGRDVGFVKGVDYIFHGHTIVKKPVVSNNRVYLDTGVKRGFGLTIAVIEPNNDIWFYNSKEVEDL